MKTIIIEIKNNEKYGNLMEISSSQDMAIYEIIGALEVAIFTLKTDLEEKRVLVNYPPTPKGDE